MVNEMLASQTQELKHSLDRDEYQDTFYFYLRLMKFTSDQGYSNSFYEGFENDTFYIHAFHWGGCTCGLTCPIGTDDMTSPEEHDSECLIYKPNFIYKPSDFRLDWYKHPLRSNNCNKEMTLEQFHDMMEDCLKSLRGQDNSNVT